MAPRVTILSWLLINLLPFSPAPPGLARIPLSQLGKNSRRAYLCWNQLHRRADGEQTGLCLTTATDMSLLHRRALLPAHKPAAGGWNILNRRRAQDRETRGSRCVVSMCHLPIRSSAVSGTAVLTPDMTVTRLAPGDPDVPSSRNCKRRGGPKRNKQPPPMSPFATAFTVVGTPFQQ